MAIGQEGNVKWVDGIRGLASTLVLLTHITRSFDTDLFRPTSAEDAAPRLLQLPFLRVLVQGRLGVTIFAFVTGYVCALKPIKLCMQGNQDQALSAIGKSALRRVPRLVLPTSIILVILWVLINMGAFEVARHCDSYWAKLTSPPRIPMSLTDALRDLIYNLTITWTVGMNRFESNQWTMLPLLKASMLVYTFILATAHIRQRYRMILSLALMLYYYCSGDATFGYQAFWGTFLCDLQYNESALAFLATRKKLCRALSFGLIFIGLFFASFPEDRSEWMTWSRIQHDMFMAILPENSDLSRAVTSLGFTLVTLGLHFSPWVRELLSNRYLIWLGKQSFAVYLIHGPLLRTVLVWMMYGIHPTPDEQNEEGEWVPSFYLEYPGRTWFLVCISIWIPLNYGLAMLWTNHVDPFCARITERFVKKVTGAGSEPKPSILPS